MRGGKTNRELRARFAWWIKRGSGIIFDTLHGVDTGVGVSAENLEIASGNIGKGIAYDPCRWWTLRRSLDLVSLRPEGYILWISVRVKERSCCPLSFCPSSRLSGSNSRPTSAGSPSEISPLRDSFTGDVYPCSLCAPMLSSTRYWSGQPFFFANPFHYDIMELVLDKIVVSYLKIPRSIFLIFCGTLTIMPQISEFLSAKSGGRAQWRVSTTLGLGQRSVNIFELPPS